MSKFFEFPPPKVNKGANRETISRAVRDTPQLHLEPYDFFNRLGNMGRIGMAWVGPSWYMAAKEAFSQLSPVLYKVKSDVRRAVQEHLYKPKAPLQLGWVSRVHTVDPFDVPVNWDILRGEG